MTERVIVEFNYLVYAEELRDKTMREIFRLTQAAISGNGYPPHYIHYSISLRLDIYDSPWQIRAEIICQ